MPSWPVDGVPEPHRPVSLPAATVLAVGAERHASDRSRSWREAAGARRSAWCCSGGEVPLSRLVGARSARRRRSSAGAGVSGSRLAVPGASADLPRSVRTSVRGSRSPWPCRESASLLASRDRAPPARDAREAPTTASSAAAARQRPATTGFRRHHRQARSDRPDRPRHDRLAGQEPPQVLGQRGGRVVPLGRVLLQALQRDRLDVARQARHQPRRRHRLGRLDLLERLQHRRPPERRAAGQQLVEDRPQRVDVGRRADLPWSCPRPARGPCSWASPGSSRSASAPTRRPAAWPGRSRRPWACRRASAGCWPA